MKPKEKARQQIDQLLESGGHSGEGPKDAKVFISQISL
jgi:hypothetical protein